METVNISNLDQLAGGALTEKFNEEMSRVLENIYDPNTTPDKARTITIQIQIKPNKDRDSAKVILNCKATLVAPDPVETHVFIDRDSRGNVVASEITKSMPGQIDLEGQVTSPKVTQLGFAANN